MQIPMLYLSPILSNIVVHIGCSDCVFRESVPQSARYGHLPPLRVESRTQSRLATRKTKSSVYSPEPEADLQYTHLHLEYISTYILQTHSNNYSSHIVDLLYTYTPLLLLSKTKGHNILYTGLCAKQVFLHSAAKKLYQFTHRLFSKGQRSESNKDNRKI